MRTARVILALAGAAILALTGCASETTPHLMNLHSTTGGPDEFGILPPKALEMPKDIAVLPDPTPGGENLTDQHPKDDAIIALGGKPPKAADGIPAADSVLYAYASRYGVTSGIRELVAAEDLEWRRRNNGRLMERLFNVNVYFKSYRAMALDQFAALEHWRALGVRTPSAPPPKPGE